jgi:hypothetical protein
MRLDGIPDTWFMPSEVHQIGDEWVFLFYITVSKSTTVLLYTTELIDGNGSVLAGKSGRINSRAYLVPGDTLSLTYTVKR